MKRADIESLVSKVVQAALSSEKAAWQEERDKAEATWTRKVADLEARVEELGRQPDPLAAPYRGPRLAERRSAVNEAAKSAADLQQIERVAQLQHMTTSTDPMLRGWALKQLAAVTAS